MAQVQNISKDLYDLIVSRGWEPETTDSRGQVTQPQDATVFSFDYVSAAGKNYGTAVIVLNDDDELEMFYGDNLGKGMEDQDKNEWFQFLQQMKQFAVRHDFRTFSPRNLNQLKHTMAGMAAIKEGLFEGYYGTRKVSYAGEPTQARLMIRHNRPLGETDARHRNVDSLFIETAEGERWKLPFRMLAGGRAMLEHVRHGGRPYDVRGVHISEMVSEINTLARFRRATQGRVVEGVAQELIEQASQYLTNQRVALKSLAHARGYDSYFETWSPADINQNEQLVEQVKNLFVETKLDVRIEAALPLLTRLQQAPLQEADIFEGWINRLAEGSWALPDTPESQKKLAQLLSQELPVGPDAANVIEQIYDIFGDDELFDRLQDLAKRDPDADARDTIRSRASELGIELPQQPELDQTPPQQPVTEQAQDPDYYEKLAKKHEADGQRGTPANRDYATKMVGRARKAADILKKGGSQEQALRHYRGTAKEQDVAEGYTVDDEDDDEQGSFFVAIYNIDDNSTFVGEISKRGGRWRCGRGRGKEPYGWGGHTFMSYLTVQDVMTWIHKDYSRGYEVEGPFDSLDEAVQFAEHNFGPLAEGDNLATFVGPNEDSTDAMDHRGAVTDSFYEDLSRIKNLAFVK